MKQEPTQQPEGWKKLEKEFLLKFATFYTPAWGRKYDDNELEFINILTANTRLGEADPKEVFQWIRQEIEAARREGIEEGYKHGWEYSRYANRKHEVVDRTIEEFFRYDSSTNLIPLTLEQLKQKYRSAV